MTNRSMAKFASGVLIAALASLGGCRSAHPGQSPAALRQIDAPHATVVYSPTTQPENVSSRLATKLQPMTLSIGAPATDKTEPTVVELAWTRQELIIHFACQCDSPPYSPYGDKRDALHYQGDAVEVFLDPVGDGRQYFEIQVSPANGVLDQNTTLTADPKYDADGILDRSIHIKDFWADPGFDIKGLRTDTAVIKQSDGFLWTTDIFLPAEAVLKRLGKKSFEPMTLRMNFMRYHWTGPIEDKNRRLIPMNWSPVMFGCPHISADRMGFVRLVEK